MDRIVMIILCFSFASCIKYPRTLRVQTKKSIIFQWNSTKNIVVVYWGLKDNSKRDVFTTKFVYADATPENNTDGAVKGSPYEGRVSFVGNLFAGRAWFKLTNVQLNDANNYSAKIDETIDSGSVFLTTRLIVTETPTFTVKPHAITTAIENKELSINCAANGPPKPNITWVNVINGNTLAKGIGSAILSVKTIHRSHEGLKYRCEANNNPNEQPVVVVTTIEVYYKPTIDKDASNTTGTSWNGHSISLRCKWSTANPPPTWTWYKPDGANITDKSRSIHKGSEVTVTTGQDSNDYGSYRCEANNVAGSDVHQIKVTQLFPPSPPKVTVNNIEASSVTVHWTKPAYDGGSPVTGYKLTRYGSKPKEFGKSVIEDTVSGLTKYTQYVVKLYARNVVGYGKAGNTTFRTKKQGPPAQPIIESAVRHHTSVTLTWSEPANNGDTITGYTIYKKVKDQDSTWTQVVHISGTPLTYTVKNLEPGETYLLIVTATNEHGESVKDDSKAKSVTIPAESTTPPTPSVVPDSPAILKVLSTASTIEISWRRPSLDGGSPIIDYQISINTKPLWAAVSVKDTSVIIAGLSKATKYQVNVLARNVVGYSNATSTYISTKNEDGMANEQLSGSVVLGVCLPIIFILLLVIVLRPVYDWWKRRKEKENEARPSSSSNNKEEAIYMNNIALQDQISSNVAQYESVNNQEQQQPTTQLYQSLQTQSPSDTYSSLSPNTKLPPKPEVITNSGVYQDIQDASHPQYQSLDNFSRV